MESSLSSELAKLLSPVSLPIAWLFSLSHLPVYFPVILLAFVGFQLLEWFLPKFLARISPMHFGHADARTRHNMWLNLEFLLFTSDVPNGKGGARCVDDTCPYDNSSGNGFLGYTRTKPRPRIRLWCSCWSYFRNSLWVRLAKTLTSGFKPDVLVSASKHSEVVGRWLCLKLSF